MGTNFWGGANTAEFLTDEIKIKKDSLAVTKILKNLLGTGALTPVTLTPVNAGISPDVTVSGGTGVITNDSDPLNPTFIEVTWATQNVTAVLTGNATYFYVDSAGVIQQQATELSNEERRDYIRLGVVNTIGGQVNTAQAIVIPQIDTPNLISDLSRAIGLINTQGNLIGDNGANLQISKTYGEVHQLGANYDTNVKDPSIVEALQLAGSTFSEFYSDGAGGVSSTAQTNLIDPTLWDDDSGVLQTVPNNDWTVKRVYLGPSSNVLFLTYGRAIYATLNAAKQGFLTETSIIPETPDSLILLGYIFSREDVGTGGSSGLDDTSRALFVQANKFGTGVGAGASGIENTRQETYNNSTSGLVTLNDVIAGIIYRDTETPVAGALLAIENSAATTRYFAVHSDRTEYADADGQHDLRPEYNVRQLQGFKTVDALTFFTTSSGAVGATDETVNQLDGFRSANLTQLSATNTDYWETATFSVFEKIYKKKIAFAFDFNSNASSNSYRVETILSDGSDRVVADQLIDREGFGSFVSEFTPESADNAVKFRIYPEVPNDANILIVDNFRIDISGTQVKEFTTTHTYSATLDSSFNIQTIKENTGDLYTVEDGNTDILVTAKQDLMLNVSSYVRASTQVAVSIYGPDNVRIGNTDIGDVAGNQAASASANQRLVAGQTVRIDNYNEGTFFSSSISLYATAQSSGTVFASDTNKEDSALVYDDVLSQDGSGFITPQDLSYSQGSAITLENGYQFTAQEDGVYDASFSGLATSSANLAIVNKDSYNLNVFDGQSGWSNGSVSVYLRKGEWLAMRNLDFASTTVTNLRFAITKQSVNVDNLIIENFGTTVSNLNQPLNQLNSVGLAGNGGESVGASSPIPFAGTGTGWDGSRYTVQYPNSIVSLKSGIFISGNISTDVFLYKNGTLYKRIWSLESGGSRGLWYVSYLSEEGEFSSGDILDIRMGGAVTLNNNATIHYLNIVEDARQLNIDTFVIENPEGEFETVKNETLSGTFSGTGVITQFTTPLNIGDRYAIDFSGYIEPSATGFDHQIQILNGTTELDWSRIRDNTGASSNKWMHKLSDPSFVATGDLTVNVTVATNSILREANTRIKVVKLPKKLGVDQLGQVVTNHVTGGTEYEVKGQLWNGKPIYARSYEWTGSTSTIVNLDTVIGLDIIDLKSTSQLSGQTWINDYQTSTNQVYGEYNSTTGAVSLVASGFTVTKFRMTLKYTKL